MNFNLDFSIETSRERRDFIASKDLSQLTHNEIELCSNYILYGKEVDKDMTSAVDRKEIQIPTKFSSYKKKEPISLDELLESPTFNEGLLSYKPTIYKNVKPVIDREKAKNIVGMKELWDQINEVQKLLEGDKNGDGQCLTQKSRYYLKHHLIDLRKQQYYLLNSEIQTLPPIQNRKHYFDNVVDLQMNYPVFPRGVMRIEDDEEFKNPRQDKNKKACATLEKLELIRNNGKPYFNFLDKEHVYQLILFYWDIKMSIERIPDSPLHNLLWTLDFYIEKAGLNEQQQLIIRDKKYRLLNKDIAKHLLEELGIYHQENYISTIWNKTVQQITEAAELNYDEWLNKDYDKAWKVCNCCRKELLRDARNFIRKTRALDGLTSCCKKCEKEKRRKENGGKIN